jgi:cation/acetate symporter
LGISPEGIGSLGMLLNFIVTIIVSRMTAPPSEDVMRMVDEMRLPREAPATDS